jgi:putative ABC transport system permease protein
MKLAWRNLKHDRLRFATTIIGIAFATFLMVFQGDLFIGFLHSASNIIDAADADIWIVPRGVNCFQYGAPMPKRFRDLAFSVSGVGTVTRVLSGWVPYQTPSGSQRIVFVIGGDGDMGSGIPLPYLQGNSGPLLSENLVIDKSNLQILEITSLPVEVELNGSRASVVRAADGFGSFVGAPFVFTSYFDAEHYLAIPPEYTMFLLVSVSLGANVGSVQRELRDRLPEVEVLTKREFSNRARFFWVIETGAGAALLIAAVLGFLVGLVVVSQNIYATTIESLDEFATLKAMGASRHYVQGVVLHQALISGLLGSFLGLTMTFPIVEISRSFVSWVESPWWIPVIMIPVSLGMCALASLLSIRKAVSVEPARVFRE